jgi:hypothetical protein
MALWAAGAALLGGVLAGEASKSGAETASDAQHSAARLIAEQAEEAKNLIFKITPIAESNLLAGQQASMNLLGSSVGPQADLARGGNVAAQKTLLAGLPQMQNAIMGRDVDLSQIQAYEGGGTPDINYQLPEFQSSIPDSRSMNPDVTQVGKSEPIQNQALNVVNQTYAGLLGREPDPSGLDIYMRFIAPQGHVDNDRVDQMKAEIMKSPEYLQMQQGGAGGNVSMGGGVV